MQRLMRFRILCGIHKSFHIFHPAPRQVCRQSSSGLRAPRWSDHDTPEEFNFASSVLDYWAQMEKEGKRGSETALWWVNGQGDEVKWSFREISDLTRRTANVFTQACGLQQGDHLALILPRVPEWWLVTVGCIRTGIVFIPGTTQLTAKDIMYRLQASKAKAIVTTDTLAPTVDSVASECPTLRTKLLVSDHKREGWLDFRSLISKVTCYAEVKGLNEKTLKFKKTLRKPFQWPKGMTCGVFRGMNIKLGSMGKAISPFDIQIIDDKGNILPPNAEGNIGIRIKPTRPPGLFMYYENNPKETAKVECGDFYNTGDRATMDAEGYLWFLGRDDDIINASGYRIGPVEVENALAEHPAVAESAVVSSPDPKRGEVVKAFIVLYPEFLSHDKDQLTKDLQQHVKSVTAPYKYPRKVEFVLELPKTITGKIKRSDLRKKEFGGMSSGKKTEPTLRLRQISGSSTSHGPMLPLGTSIWGDSQLHSVARTQGQEGDSACWTTHLPLRDTGAHSPEFPR
nr:acyl-coenzyme A synthetase ACSM1, mitochondrial-like [Marmota flaviventris]